MRFIRIDVEGEKPGHYTSMTRKQGSEYIEVQVFTSGYVRTHHVVAESRDDQWSMAEGLQAILDGYRGAGGDVRGYFNAIQMLGGC